MPSSITDTDRVRCIHFVYDRTDEEGGQQQQQPPPARDVQDSGISVPPGGPGSLFRYLPGIVQRAGNARGRTAPGTRMLMQGCVSVCWHVWFEHVESAACVLTLAAACTAACFCSCTLQQQAFLISHVDSVHKVACLPRFSFVALCIAIQSLLML